MMLKTGWRRSADYDLFAADAQAGVNRNVCAFGRPINPKRIIAPDDIMSGLRMPARIGGLMVESEGGSNLASVHRQLVEALAYLDRTGCQGAAAHLVAAIELIEDDLDPVSRRAETASESLVAVIARRMVEGFGHRAQAVARAQLADATGPAMLTWAAIINRIP